MDRAESPVEILTTAEDLDKQAEAEKVNRPTWCPSSELLLKESEEKILNSTKAKYNARYVNVGTTVGNKKDCKIWTVSFNESSKEIPLVLLHGFGAGVAFWAMNFSGLSKARPVHAIDLPGFARSSRPTFNSCPEKAEVEFVESVEAWRSAMKLEKIILVGHSFGAYLSTAYAIRFPEPVTHLILADPWGFKEKPENLSDIERFKNIPFYVKVIFGIVQHVNPLSALRFFGKFGQGPRMIASRRQDIIARFEDFVEDAQTNVANYIYYCNAQNPTGESAFHSLQSSVAWAKNPMKNRLHLFDQNVPLTLIYGSKSWMDHYPLEDIKKALPSAHVDLHIMEGATHHVYADNVAEFNQIINRACQHCK